MATSPVTNGSNDFFAGILPSALWRSETASRALYPAWISKASPKRESAVCAESPVVAAQSDEDSASLRDQILIGHLPLVRFVARKIHERLPHHVELDDLIGAGVLGLIDAFQKFDAAKNIQFRSYAQFRIRGAILDSLRSLDWGSRELRRKGRNIEAAAEKLTRRSNRRPTESEMAAELGMTLGEYQLLVGNLKRLEIGSLQEAHAEGSPEEELAYVPTAPEEDPLFRCMQSEAASRLHAAMVELPARDARVLALYYGEEWTLKQIGLHLGLAESRVSQIRVAAVRTLRGWLSAGEGSRKTVAMRETERVRGTRTSAA